MTEPKWKLTIPIGTTEATVVWREWPKGRQESCLVTAEAYLAWLSEGNEPLPADEPEEQP